MVTWHIGSLPCILLIEANVESSSLHDLVQCLIYHGCIKLTNILASQNIVRVLVCQSIFNRHSYWWQSSSVQSLSRVWLCVTPGTAALQASLSITKSWSLLKLLSTESVTLMASLPLYLNFLHVLYLKWLYQLYPHLKERKVNLGKQSSPNDFSMSSSLEVHCLPIFRIPTLLSWRRQWQPTPVFLPGESQGQGSLVGSRLRGHTESGTTEVT